MKVTIYGRGGSVSAFGLYFLSSTTTIGSEEVSSGEKQVLYY